MDPVIEEEYICINVHTYVCIRFISEGVAGASQILLRDAHVLHVKPR
jgi:hypothetical protein